MSNRFLVSGVFIFLILGVGAVSGLSQGPKLSLDKSINQMDYILI